MSSASSPIETKVAEMRRRFDEAFAAPQECATEALEALLAIRVGGEEHALRLRDISALTAARRIVPVPARFPELVGITALRGDVLPVFSLSRLLGLGGNSEQVRWIVRAGEGSDAVGLGFNGLDGYFQVDAAEIFPGAGQPDRPYVSATARQNGILRGVVDLPLLVERIRQRAANLPGQEWRNM